MENLKISCDMNFCLLLLNGIMYACIFGKVSCSPLGREGARGCGSVVEHLVSIPSMREREGGEKEKEEEERREKEGEKGRKGREKGREEGRERERKKRNLKGWN
jgi:hypothetical protein